MAKKTQYNQSPKSHNYENKTFDNIHVYISNIVPLKKISAIFLWIKLFIRKAYKLPMKQLNKYSCSGSVVRPIISASRAEDSGSNPGRSIYT